MSSRIVGLDDALLCETVHGRVSSRLRCVHGEYRRPLLSNESDWIDLLKSRLPGPPTEEIWVGDDAAVVRPPTGLLLLAADTLVEGVHADLGLTNATDLGWKALAVNVSDIAAMGGRPLHALVTVVVPLGREVDLVGLYDGLEEAAREFACPIVGGDLSSGPTFVVTVAVTGTIDDGGPPSVLRSGAKPDDHLFVTGPLGAAAAGLRALREGNAMGRVIGDEVAHLLAAHRRPVPRVVQGSVARRAGATAMMDLSDGLAMDLRRLAVASGVGVILDNIPVALGATEDEAVCGGDDYELLIATPDPERLMADFLSAGLERPVSIGHCTDLQGDYRLGSDELPAGGWEHQW